MKVFWLLLTKDSYEARKVRKNRSYEINEYTKM